MGTTFAGLSNITIHLGPGTFPTAGFNGATGWKARPGMKILGAGVAVTTLKLTSITTAGVHYFAVGHADTATVDDFEISNLTIDCNIGDTTNNPANAAFGGVRVMGNHARIRRVKVINWGTKSAAVPGFALSLVTANPDAGIPEVVNATMEDCVVDLPYGSNATVAACA